MSKATIDLDDAQTKAHFDVVKAEMEKRVPGMRPNSADVLRYSLYSAAQQCGANVDDVMAATSNEGK